MFAVIINEKGGQPRRQEFTKSEVTIGRVQGNDIILPKQNVSKRHSRIVVKDGKFIIVDLKSTNGTYVNGRKIASPMVIKESDKIYVGDFILSVENVESADAGLGANEPSPGMMAGAGASVEPPRKAPPPPPRPKPARMGVPNPTPRPMPPPPGQAPMRPTPAPIPPPATPAPVPAAAPEPAPAAPPAPTTGRVPVPVRPTAPAPVPTPAAAPPSLAPRPSASMAAPAAVQLPPPGDEATVALLALHDRLAQQLPDSGLLVPSTVAPSVGIDQRLWRDVEAVAQNAWRELEAAGRVPQGADAAAATSLVVSEIVALGPLTSLLDDEAVERVTVNAADRILVTRDGKTEAKQARFTSNAQVVAVTERLLRAAGAHVDSGSTFAEGSLPDGLRVHAAFPAVGGPYLTIERPLSKQPSLSDLVGKETLNGSMATFLSFAVSAGRVVVVTSNDVEARIQLIAAMAGEAGKNQRIVAVEGAGALSGQRDTVTLTAGPGADPAMVVQQAAKMHADRLIVFDCRGPEAFHALSAVSGGVNGGVLGLAAGSPEEAVVRLGHQVGLALPASTDRVEAFVRDTVDVVAQVTRFPDGRVRVVRVSELTDDGLNPVFDGENKFRATGHVPQFVGQAQRLGHTIDLNIFR